MNKTKTRKKKQTTKVAQPTQIHELKITLKHSKPPIWRRVAVPSDMLLSDLHWVIQIVMGWTNSHLHQFVIRSNKNRLTTEEMRAMFTEGDLYKLTEYINRNRCFSDPRFELEDAEDESKVELCELAPNVKSKFVYEYDFGDSWEHIVETVKIGPPEEKIKYPVCLKGKLACPPEDCGGIWGYYEMLEILKDPKHERYDELLDWIGGSFDSENFNIQQVNSILTNFKKEIKHRTWMPY